MTGKRTHVVVIGGGYAGTLAANHLRSARRRRHHPGQPAAEVRRADPAAPARRRHPCRGSRLRHAARRGHSAGRRQRRPGSTPPPALCSSRRAAGRCTTTTSSTRSAAPANAPASVPGAAEFAYPIAEFEYAELLRDTLDDLHPGAPVTVVGAGLTGIETASELAEQGRRVTLVCGGQLAPSLSKPGRRVDRQVVRQARRRGARARRGGRGPRRRGGLRRRRGTPERCHHLDGRFRRA